MRSYGSAMKGWIVVVDNHDGVLILDKPYTDNKTVLLIVPYGITEKVVGLQHYGLHICGRLIGHGLMAEFVPTGNPSLIKSVTKGSVIMDGCVFHIDGHEVWNTVREYERKCAKMGSSDER